MNFYEELKSKKTLGILILICLIFLILIIKAYSFLPDSDNSSNNIYESENSQVENIVQDQESTNTEEETNIVDNDKNQNRQSDEDEEIIKRELERQKIREIEKQRMEEIEKKRFENINSQDTELKTDEMNALEQNELTIEVQYNNLFTEASKLYTEKQYVRALEEYQKAANIVSDKELQAKCYEQMSIIYATVKKYGTALAFAQKSFNAAPTTAREILLARLYYKTGNIDKATTRVNNVLKRDFSADK